MIKIVAPPIGSLGIGTKVCNQEGSELEGVLAIDIKIRPQSFTQAELTVHASVEEVWAQPFMSETSFLEAAKRYGYTVSKG